MTQFSKLLIIYVITTDDFTLHIAYTTNTKCCACPGCPKKHSGDFLYMDKNLFHYVKH